MCLVALKAIYDTKGYCIMVTDEEVIAAQQLLGRCILAGLKKVRERGIIDKDERVVCIYTGNGLKDPDITIKTFPVPISCTNDVKAVEKILG